MRTPLGMGSSMGSPFGFGLLMGSPFGMGFTLDDNANEMPEVIVKATKQIKTKGASFVAFTSVAYLNTY